MLTQELGSELSRSMLGIIPASNIPEIVLSQFSLIGWDHHKNPSFIWRLSDLTMHDGEGKGSSIDGFRITNSEVMAIIRGGELLALLPEGSWIMKPEAVFMATLEASAGKFELVWIDLRTIILRFEVMDLRTETGRHRLHGELALSVVDPTKLVNKFILTNSKALSKDIQDDVLDELLALMSSEASTRSPDDPSWQQHVEESSKIKLVKRISNWGLMPSDLGIVEERRESGSAQRVKAKEIESTKAAQVPKEEGPSSSVRIPVESTPLSRRTEMSQSDSALIHMLEWESAPKTWIPLNQKGKVACDGCGEHSDMFAECRLSCRFPQKCRLCKKCYPKRNDCAFLVEVVDIPPSSMKTAERFAQSANKERELGSPTTR